MGVSHIEVKRYILEGWVDSGRVAYLRRGIFWEEGIDSGSVAYIVEKGVYSRKMGYILRAPLNINGGIFWEGGVDYGSVAYSCQKRGYPILGERGRLWESRI